MSGFVSSLRDRTLATDSAGRRNSIGFLRLTFASAVVVSHSRVLGFGQLDPGEASTRHQTDLGKLAVFGFFVLSGYLISGSAVRIGLGRYLWHRFLRIFPGLWVCLLLLAFVMAPLVCLHERGSLSGFWVHPGGPFDFVRANWWTGLRQLGISDLRVNPIVGIFDGPLWSLAYEMLGYLAIAALAFSTVLSRAPRLLLVLTATGWLYIVHYQVQAHTWTGGHPAGVTVTLPLLGALTTGNMVYLGFMFAFGAAAQLYKERFSTHGALAVIAALLFLLSARMGGFFVLGLPAYGYLVLWAAMRLPRRFQTVGRKRDYSYGLYIYAWPVQELLTMLNVPRWGLVAYTCLALLGGLALAALSWHLVERPALRLKDWTPAFARRWRERHAQFEDVVNSELPDIVGQSRSEPALDSSA
ncbi:acyltransferase [Actinocrinis puniceicyclus]|uniref:Acyltransferase n=1 Tax=Actinocrinis puniceicyclus TaxID=977794 RepID=A0A8J7WLQ6_9ACTN|nr:acyltransferase [Actinocrinis puniceicyclus]MBS2962027.1 acyltransferase [Actinocrinis puniceicyclus]